MHNEKNAGPPGKINKAVTLEVYSFIQQILFDHQPGTVLGNREKVVKKTGQKNLWHSGGVKDIKQGK